MPFTKDRILSPKSEKLMFDNASPAAAKRSIITETTALSPLSFWLTMSMPF